MSQFVHIVYIHPLENGEPNLSKVKFEAEFRNKHIAETFIEEHNAEITTLKAIYYGCVNDETGELV